MNHTLRRVWLSITPPNNLRKKEKKVILSQIPWETTYKIPQHLIYSHEILFIFIFYKKYIHCFHESIYFYSYIDLFLNY